MSIPCQPFEVITSGRQWSSHDTALEAETAAARLRSLGWTAFAREIVLPAAKEATRPARHNASIPTKGKAMKASEIYGAQPIKLDTFSDDLAEITGTITAVTSKQFDNGGEKLVLTIDDEFSVVVNGTSYRILRRAFGYETDDWPGKLITAYKGKTTYRGVEQDSVCVRIPPQLKTEAAESMPLQPPSGNGATDTLADDIPF